MVKQRDSSAVAPRRVMTSLPSVDWSPRLLSRPRSARQSRDISPQSKGRLAVRAGPNKVWKTLVAARGQKGYDLVLREH